MIRQRKVVPCSYEAAASSCRNLAATARSVAGLFFPLRVHLRIDGHGYSPAVLHKVVTAGGELKSFQRAAKLTTKLAEFSISGMQVSRLTHEIGRELASVRDHQAELHRYRQLKPDAQQPAVDIAFIETDGGRQNTRAAGCGRGVHQRGWRETKIACLWRMTGPIYEADPHPELPRCFQDSPRVEKLVRQLKGSSGSAADQEIVQSLEARHGVESPAQRPRWQPERQFRSCVATLRDVHGFGPLVAAEAQARGFYEASRRVFLGDGDEKNWMVQRMYFAQFTAVTDFLHPVGYVFTAAGAMSCSRAGQWSQYLRHITACWQGGVGEVIDELAAWLSAHPLPAGRLSDIPDNHPSKIVYQAMRYLENNRERMNYPEYRRAGLPVTSSLVESLIKEFNLRVNGTEKTWNREGAEPDWTCEAESILQVRAALLCDDDRLSKHIRSRPGSPYVRRRPTAATNAAA